MSRGKDFKTRLKIAKKNLDAKSSLNESKNASFMGNALRLGTELIAAVMVGTIIGFILDTWFDTKPWLIIIFFFIGSAAGMLNVIRVAKNLQKED
jgi:ATP synthase protein I|tara:strand:+ start:3018 stop:3302 length:285 start_codon:yes stop_codon:yes gene_type:complete